MQCRPKDLCGSDPNTIEAICNTADVFKVTPSAVVMGRVVLDTLGRDTAKDLLDEHYRNVSGPLPIFSYDVLMICRTWRLRRHRGVDRRE